MPRQFDVFALPEGQLVVVIQSDILDPMPTRVTVPLLDLRKQNFSFRSLTPRISIEGRNFTLAPQLTATIAIPDLGKHITNVSDQRDTITRAIDALLNGI